jgi:peptidoglycan/LPS O-acetylase OafA/YrhL
MRHHKRLDHLDSIRGLAAYFVFLSHYIAAYNTPTRAGPWLVPTWLDRGPQAFFRDGFAAVTIFLVLSGYVLSLKFWRDGKINYRRVIPSFYINRLLRIFPPFIFALFVSAALFRLKVPNGVEFPPRYSWYDMHWNLPPTWDVFLRQVFLFVPTVGDSNRLIPMDWTLTAELNISFLIPFMIVIAWATGPLLLVFVFVGVLLLKMHGFVFHFALGILLAQNQEKITNVWNRLLPAAKWTLLITAFALYTIRNWIQFIPHRELLKESWLWYITGLGAFIFLAAATSGQRIRRVLSVSPLVFLGKISYSVYLLHFCVIMALAPFILRIIPPTSTSNFWLGMAANSALVFVLSALSYWAVEKPSMNLARRLFR